LGGELEHRPAVTAPGAPHDDPDLIALMDGEALLDAC
jgi:hypothetical protein